MPRLTSQVFKDLAIWMLCCGAVVGLTLPLLMFGLGVSADESFRWFNFPAFMFSGAALGAFNFLLALRIVRPELRRLVGSMREVETTFREASFTGDWSACRENNCTVEVETDDEIGQTAEAFNELVAELIRVQSLEAASSELTDALSSKLDLEELSDKAIELVLHHTDAVAGSLLVAQDEVLRVVANHGLSDPGRLTRSDHVLRAVKTNEVQFVRINPDVMIEGVIGDFMPSQILIFPLAFESVNLGALVLASDRLFGKDAMWLLKLFQQGMGLALNNALTHDRLQQVASRDPLTSLYNRRFGMDHLNLAFDQAAHHRQALSLIMLDVDFFKKVNDTYGHLAGDQVLVEVAALSRKAIRESDVMVRYGGEEFMIIMPGATQDVVLRVGERIRAAIENYVFANADERIPVTVSLGVATHTWAMRSPEDLLKWADDALYAAKAAGRNRVVSHEVRDCDQSIMKREPEIVEV